MDFYRLNNYNNNNYKIAETSFNKLGNNLGFM